MSQQYDPCEVEMEFADGEYLFRLPRKRLAELQMKCGGVGIGAIYKRVCVTFDYHEADLFETVRLGLIGGGMDPQEAKRLISDYCDVWPLEVWHSHAFAILAACIRGYKAADDAPGKSKAARSRTAKAGSTSPQTTPSDLKKASTPKSSTI